jgi:hypothetical protein
MFGPGFVTDGRFRQSDAFIHKLPIIICFAPNILLHLIYLVSRHAGPRALTCHAKFRISRFLFRIYSFSMFCEYTSGYSESARDPIGMPHPGGAYRRNVACANASRSEFVATH